MKSPDQSSGGVLEGRGYYQYAWQSGGLRHQTFPTQQVKDMLVPPAWEGIFSNPDDLPVLD